MPRARRTGVNTLPSRAERIRIKPPRTAGKGAPCEHVLGCPRPFTTWTILGPRCDDHKQLTKDEIPVTGPDDRWRSIRSGSTSNLARTRRDTDADGPHPFAQNPGAGRGVCHCGLGIRATVHRADADEQEGDSLDG